MAFPSALRLARLGFALCVIAVICASYFVSCEKIENVPAGTAFHSETVGSEEGNLLENTVVAQEASIATTTKDVTYEPQGTTEVVKAEIPVEINTEENTTEDAESAASSRRLNADNEEHTNNDTGHEASVQRNVTPLTAAAAVTPGGYTTDAEAAYEAVDVTENVEPSAGPGTSEAELTRDVRNLEDNEDETPSRSLAANEEVSAAEEREGNVEASPVVLASEEPEETTETADEPEAAPIRRLRGSAESAEEAGFDVNVDSDAHIAPDEDNEEPEATESASENAEDPAEETRASARHLQEAEATESVDKTAAEMQPAEGIENTDEAQHEQDEMIQSVASAEESMTQKDASPADIGDEGEQDGEQVEVVSATAADESSDDKACTEACERKLSEEETEDESASPEAGAEGVVDGEAKADNELVSEEPSESDAKESELSRTPEVDEQVSDAVSLLLGAAEEILEKVHNVDI
uniref:Putative transmembrane protein n=1 Tax=Toxoplasma gondii COUG TaxID=1074873 RepID=A0A2G8Y465_TOXGO|nr:putative transmembrane protein [Toxoplasma gondii COUG]